LDPKVADGRFAADHLEMFAEESLLTGRIYLPIGRLRYSVCPDVQMM